ncbi:MAG: histidine kinase [Prevotella sp.]|jgi:signal transduction histidine kinase|nr:histidine kinase [Prevotella sp.]
MNKLRTITAIGLLLVAPLLYPQANRQTDKDPVLDSLIAIIENKKTPFGDRYRIDSIVRNSPALKKYRNIICLRLIPEAKKEKAYNELSRLYAHAAAYFSYCDELPATRLYLDSVKPYINRIVDPRILADYYRTTGEYHGALRQSDTAHIYFYKAIEYYEKVKDPRSIIRILRNMTINHFNKRNYAEIKKILGKMKSVSTTDKDDKAYADMTIDEIAGGLYEDLYGETGTFSDSVQYYYRHAIGVYESLDSVKERTYREKMFFIYAKLAEIEARAAWGKANWTLIDGYMAQAKKICNPKDSLQLAFIHIYDAAVDIEKHQYGKAERELNKARDIIDILGARRPEYQNGYNDIYRKYIDLYKATGDYEKALKYVELAHQLKNRYIQESNSQIIKDLDIKYETAEKELKIKELRIEKEKEQQTKIRITGGALFIIVLLLVFFLYNRTLRLKKEKETILLSNEIKQKDLEFQSVIAKSELNAMRSYLNGLEAERERLAKELHDSVANRLLGIDVQLRKAMQMPENISIQLENLHNEIRNISHELIPPLFKYASLPEIISDYVSKANKNNIDIDLQIEDIPEHISEKHALEIYRIIQEATSNIVKHSGASAAKISLWSCESFLKLTVEDNGKGFDINRKQTGIGLRIIKDRVAGLNGVFHIYSLPDSGCKIDINIPISQLNGDK